MNNEQLIRQIQAQIESGVDKLQDAGKSLNMLKRQLRTAAAPAKNAPSAPDDEPNDSQDDDL